MLIATLDVMLLQHIVETLDAELNRLYQLRDIVSDLDGSVEIVLEVAAPLAAAEPSRTEPSEITPIDVPKPVRRKRSPAPAKREPPTTRKANESQAALKGTIPAGPVVVSAAALAKEHAARHEGSTAPKVPPPPAPPGSLASMIRALHLDGAL